MNCLFKTAVTPASPRAGSKARRLLAAALSIVGFAASTQAQEVLYTENFNTEGENIRYTVEGGGVFTGLPTTGPAYWARNAAVTAIGKVVGVGGPAPEKRAVLVFNHNLTASTLTPEALKLIDGTIKWLTGGKPNLKVLFSAAANPGEGDQLLVQRLTDQGHTVTDDPLGNQQDPDGLPDPSTIDLVINGSSAGEPARLWKYAVPMLSYRAAISGDLFLATRGETGVSLDPGEIQIQAPNHPIAAGLPAKFSYVTEAQTFDTIGLGIPAGAITVATYQYTSTDGTVSTRPLLVVIDKGVQLLGGLISGMEGSGFWAGADINAPQISNPPDDPPRAGPLAGRSLTLKPVNVTGKPKLKLSFLLAGTEVDFDGPGGDDFLSIKVDLANTGEFIELARYGSPTASEKFLVEMIKGGDGIGGPTELVIPDYTKRIGVVARDLTYDIPDGATQLVVRFEGLSTFWNEIFAFDNVRITSGDIVAAPPHLTYSVAGDEITLTWAGSYVLEKTGALPTGWAPVDGAASGYKTKFNAGTGFFRLK